MLTNIDNIKLSLVEFCLFKIHNIGFVLNKYQKLVELSAGCCHGCYITVKNTNTIFWVHNTYHRLLADIKWIPLITTIDIEKIGKPQYHWHFPPSFYIPNPADDKSSMVKK